MINKSFPEWFIDALYLDSDKEKARKNNLSLNDVLYFKCDKGHLTKCKLVSKICVKTMCLKAALCPICNRQNRVTNCKKSKALHRVYPQWFIDELLNEEDKERARNNTLQGNDVVEFKCQKGHIYSKKVSYRIKKNGDSNFGCYYCSLIKNSSKSMKKINYPKWFIDELLDMKDKERAISGELPLTQKVRIQCPSCFNEYTRFVRLEVDYRTGNRVRNCPKCALKLKKYKSIKHTLDYPDWFINQIVDPLIKEKAITNELSSKENVVFRCTCGHLFTRIVSNYIKLSDMTKRTECPFCLIESKKSLHKRNYPSWFIDDLKNENDKISASSGILKTTDNVEFICRECGNTYTTSVGNRIKLSTNERKHSCPICGNKIRFVNRSNTLDVCRHYPQWFIDELADECDKEKIKSKSLKSTDIVSLRCPKGHIYKQLVGNHIALQTGQKKSECPICNSNRSKSEFEIEKYIKSLGFNTMHKRFKNPQNNNYFEIDVYIPDKNVGIEYNGSYYHKTLPKDTYSKDKLYHQNKYLSCKQLGIKLISIFEPDWNERQDKVKQYLKDTLQPTQQKIYARKCDIKHITSVDANMMYDRYHLLGKTTIQSISYGLYYNNELVSCMSFQKGRYKENKEPVWCLTRFVTKSGFIVIGGASKLLTAFEKEYHPSLLISYSDNDYFQGGVYSKLGFDCLCLTKSPRYYWFTDNTELKREQCQLKKLAKKYPELHQESLSISGNKEDYIMLKLGAMKVYRSGHTKWVKTYR